MKNFLATVILIITLVSCSKEKQTAEVLIRVQNETSVQVSDVRIYSGTSSEYGTETERKYGNILSGSYSGYLPHDKVSFNFPSFSFNVSGLGLIKASNDLTCPVGDQILSAGLYTLVIRQEGSSVFANLKAD